MTEALAAILAERLKAQCPFLHRVVGMVRLHTRAVNDGDSVVIERLPVPTVYTGEECEQNARYLTPDQHTGGVLFFEDGGDIPVLPTSLGLREATLRLVGWVNPFLLTGLLSEQRLLWEIEKALGVRRRYNAGQFRGIYITSSILPAGPALFSSYSFGGAAVTPLLLPPYRCFGLELKVRYQLSRICYPAPLPVLDLERNECGLPRELEPEPYWPSNVLGAAVFDAIVF